MLSELTSQNRKIAVPEKDELKKMVKDQREILSVNQLKIKEAKKPVMVIFEGWGASGKGSMIGKIIRNLDPRFFAVSTMDARPTPQEQRFPFLYRYLIDIPEAGKFRFYDTCWMEEVTNALLLGNGSEEEFTARMKEINTIERQLADNGYILLKFFLHIDKEEQEKRLHSLRSDDDTSWRVDEDDAWENEHYEECFAVYDRYLEYTNRTYAPWYIIDAQNKKLEEYQVLSILNQAITTSLENSSLAVPIVQNIFPLTPMPKLADVDLDKTIEQEEYKKRLDKLQSKLSKLSYRLYKEKIPVIICYEGWDAAGKGGNIRRITEALDPRDFIVNPVASPEPHEKARFYLWRFWKNLPKTGHIAIFDRTWYGRVMVERLEGFCSQNDWQRAYNEMNEFEKMLTDWGAIVIKFWVQIDKDTQLERFTDRQNTPEKQWKITDEDWRNRDKWDLYEGAVNEMLQKTSTAFAPWYILESNDKKYARIKALETVIAAAEAKLAEKEKA